MTVSDWVKLVFWGVGSRPARTAALVVSLAVGVAAAVFVTGIVGGFAEEIDRIAFGAHRQMLIVRTNALVPDRLGGPRLAEAEILRVRLPGVQDVALWKDGEAAFHAQGRTSTVTLFGVRGAFEAELDTPVVQGRNLTSEETAGFARVCLAGVEFATEFPDQVRVGARIRINGGECEIVGVLGEPASRPAARFAMGVVTPLGAAERFFLSEADRGAPGEVDRIGLLMTPNVDMADAEMRADLLLRRLRGAALSRPSPFLFGDPNASLSQMVEQQRMLARLMAVLASLTVSASLVAFASISAAAMTSRRREIAIRLALGATPRDIQVQVFLEAVVVGALGGVTGLIAGLAIGRAASAIWGWAFVSEWPLAFGAVGLGLVVGSFTGALFAWRSSRLPPALAART